MYLTILFSLLALITGVLGYIGFGYGILPEVRIFFFGFLIVAIFFFIVERRAKSRKYYD